MYIDDGGGEPAIKSIMESMVDFARTAARGGFEISEAGGDHILGAIDDFQKWIDDQSDRLRTLEQERMLGITNGAKVMGPYLQQVAIDDRGFITQLRALRESLTEARKGIELAVAAYRRTEEATQANLKNIPT